MERLFRNYFWAINLAFLLGAAWFGAKAVNTAIASYIAPKPEPFTSAASAPSNPQGPPKTELSPERLANATGIALPKPPDPVEEAQGGPSVPLEEQEATRSGLRVKLLGTLAANRAEWSMANIEDVATRESKVYMVGDTIQSAEIIDIERMRVYINNQGRREFIDQEPGDGSTPTAIAPTPTAPPTAAAAGSGIRAVGDGNYEIPREEINKAMENWGDMAKDARIVPAFKDGQANGFKLFSIKPDSLYSKIGIQNGDVVRRVNGFEINSPDKALEVYSKLKEAGRIEIDIERGGASRRMTYNVR